MRLPLKSPSVAIWLSIVAAMVVLIVMVGGATRLTGSGLSITEWKPIHGVVPPLNDAQWAEEFTKYQQIPQYKQVNANMSVEQFKFIFWWEWGHRLLGRLIGAAVLIPFIVFLFTQAIPQRLIWRCALLVGLVGVQGTIGWWMVHSGLANRIDVAPERLMTHLSLALVIMIFAIWTANEALHGQSRGHGAPGGWVAAVAGLFGLTFLQSMLGALVAGNDAGLVYNDWPLMGGRIVPLVDYSKGLWHVFVHDQGMVQVLHRFNAYLLLIYATALVLWLWRRCLDDGMRLIAAAFGVLVWCQAALGVATLWTNVHIAFGLLHQLGAVLLLILATLLLWKVARADRDFRRRNF
ncbi:COX15/CtaA family protein [Asticcacaulis excentricus]|uniref:Heme A synthase n=1 Tax=Asticcacaulis excentricus (strain ATCC 15261 / DSM 4724 / KCTC 12464 / NCIMB 9791 / VKM B-1370 / CB 48) TaxID=573065 RepID=E8RSJ9_ASTEC|nr:COX15/CtaA family protein [Asticcacaulis excentricus]ADU14470.1 cytochrome oxidase assembly [Asticcacaulis excentricus CB 48]